MIIRTIHPAPSIRRQQTHHLFQPEHWHTPSLWSGAESEELMFMQKTAVTRDPLTALCFRAMMATDREEEDSLVAWLFSSSCSFASSSLISFMMLMVFMTGSEKGGFQRWGSTFGADACKLYIALKSSIVWELKEQSKILLEWNNWYYLFKYFL